MAIRKRYEESLTVSTDRSRAYDAVATALAQPPFQIQEQSRDIGRIGAKHKSFTAPGTVEVTVHPVEGGTRVDVRVTAAVDNIYALFRSPGQKILREFRSRLTLA